MKKVLALPLLFVLSVSLAQVSHDTLRNRIIEGRMKKYATASVVTNGSQEVVIKTLVVPVNKDSVFILDIMAQSNNDKGHGQCMLSLYNEGGEYDIKHIHSGEPYKGTGSVSGGSWRVDIVNNKVVVLVKGVAGQTIKWTLAKAKS